METVSPKLKLSGRINPFYLRGDFDGDGRSDHAALVIDPDGHKGIVICRGSIPRPQVIGAGVPINEISDLSFDAWMVFPKGRVRRGVDQRPPPVLRGDAILVTWSESASGLIYWDGKSFLWYQQGD